MGAPRIQSETAEINGYTQLERLFESPRSRVFRAKRSRDGKAVILKILQEDFLERQEIARYHNQYAILTENNLSIAPAVLAFDKHLNAPMLVFEDCGGRALSEQLKEAPLSLLEGLDLAQKLAKGLVEIHGAGIIHKDINPSNILYNRQTGEVRIIDFGISTRLLREKAETETSSVTEGSLPYMSPEQTGRMNRFVDYRSDFYSFGVTLYEVFTGRLPFESSDSLRLIHYHIAKSPLPARSINLQIPEVLSDLIQRLLAKNAEDRYQSAWGLSMDMQKIFRTLREGGKLESFPLGLQDVPDRFLVSETLYGRQKEFGQLSQVFEKVRDGARELVLVSGYAGVGKSSLVKALQKPIGAARGHFASGRFDAFRRSVPYSGFIDALRELMRRFLGESEQTLAYYRERLQQALGPNAAVLVEVLPEIELFLGTQPPALALGATEAENRFKLLFKNFIAAFSEGEHPLVIHLDELQWVDNASLQMIELILEDKRQHHVLIIGSYRDNELADHHPLRLFLGNLEKAETRYTGLRLVDLDLEAVQQLIADATRSSPERVQGLAELVIRKTGGNPFFTHEFLRTLYTQRLLAFQASKGVWEWDLARIRAANMTDNVVELMSARVQSLSTEGRQVLESASCLGHDFTLGTLAAVLQQPARQVAKNLQEAIQQGLVVPVGDAYRLVELDIPLDGQDQLIQYQFSHDRIQQAAYALLPEDTRLITRYRAGRTLLALQGEKLDTNALFAVVSHLNATRHFIENDGQRIELMTLNLRASEKAKASTAYAPALEYIEAALALEKSEDWATHYALTLAIYQTAAELSFLSRAPGAMQGYTQTIMNKSRELLDRIPAFEVQIQSAMARGESQEAIGIGRRVLSELGVRLPENPSLLRVIGALLLTRFRLKGRSQEELLALPAMSSPTEKARMHFLYALSQTIFYFFPKQVPLITAVLVRRGLKFGHTGTSSLAYVTYGMIMAAMVGDVKEGYRLGELAVRLNEKQAQKDIEAAVLFCFNMFIRPFHDHVRQTLTPLLQAHQAGLDTGNFEYAAHAAMGYINRSYFVGTELKALNQDMLKFTLLIEQLGQRSDEEAVRLLHQLVINLSEVRALPFILRGDTFDEERMIPIYERNGDSAGLFNTYFYKSMLAYHFEAYSESVVFARKAEPHFKAAMSTLSGAVFFFYYSLALLAQWDQASPSERGRIQQTVEKSLKRFKKWSKHASMNFQHKHDLLAAEWLSRRGKLYEAQGLYELAIAGARSEQYLSDEALANELAAKFHMREGRPTAAHAYMRRARYNYERWGAMAKVKALEETYPHMLSSLTGERPLTGSLATMSSSTIDITTLKRALLAIAEENVHSRMLEKILSSAIEFAGAQKGVLLLRKDGEFYIEGESTIDQEGPRVLQSTALEHSQSVSRMVVNYVRRSKKGLVIDNASQPQDVLPGLHREAYTQKGRVLSILCIPITVGIGEDAQTVGLLYLENNRAAGTFTAERIETLEIICLAAAGRLELSVKAATDGLTGLFNHDYFQNMLEQEMVQSLRSQRNLSLLLIDIDFFKRFNDQWGHQLGDTVLKRVAQTIRETCRKSDVVARYGGEEMAVILPETSPEMATLVAERIRKAIENLIVPHGDENLRVTISLGLSYLSDAYRDKAMLIEKADEALYQSKHAGRNRVTVA